jgi:O-antigen ligase
MYLPTEPLIALFLLLFIFKLLLGYKLDKELLKHPVSWVIFFYLTWLLITTATSSLPIVSLKYTLVRIWYIAVFYFYFYGWMKNQTQITKSLWIYSLSLSIVLIYTLIRHSQYGLTDFKAAHFVMSPFFRDHTIYGATIALLIPPVIGLALYYKKNTSARHLVWLILVLFLVALLFSYTRAAWLSLAGSAMVLLLIHFKIKFKYLLTLTLLFIVIGLKFWLSIYYQLENNKQDSSANFEEHLESMTNIATDASNLERINRWKSAYRMFEAKPILGWGPGTYQFTYARYQFSYDKTIISTDFGNGGNAHSEYLGALSETGLLGMLIFISIYILTIYIGIRVYRETENKKTKLILMGMLLGLVSYYFHSFLNDFLDADKIAIPFWLFTATLVLYDNKRKYQISH